MAKGKHAARAARRAEAAEAARVRLETQLAEREAERRRKAEADRQEAAQLLAEIHDLQHEIDVATTEQIAVLEAQAADLEKGLRKLGPARIRGDDKESDRRGKAMERFCVKLGITFHQLMEEVASAADGRERYFNDGSVAPNADLPVEVGRQLVALRRKREAHPR